MAIALRQSTASQEIPLGYFVDSTDGNTEETGLTISNTDIKIWKNGATSLVDKNSGGATHISNGIYYCVLDATDTDTLGPLVVFVHESGALPVRVECVVLSADNYDAAIAGSSDVFDTALEDSIPADGSLPTAKQALYMITQFLLERSVSGTTVTVRKADGSTTLFTLTISDASAPTSITRTT